MIEGDAPGKLARGVKSLTTVLQRGGFKIWQAGGDQYTHTGQLVVRTAAPAVGTLYVQRRGGDYQVAAGLGYSLRGVDPRDRQRAIDLAQRARAFLQDQGYQVSDSVSGGDGSFIVKGKALV